MAAGPSRDHGDGDGPPAPPIAAPATAPWPPILRLEGLFPSIYTLPACVRLRGQHQPAMMKRSISRDSSGSMSSTPKAAMA